MHFISGCIFIRAIKSKSLSYTKRFLLLKIPKAQYATKHVNGKQDYKYKNTPCAKNLTLSLCHSTSYFIHHKSWKWERFTKEDIKQSTIDEPYYRLHKCQYVSARIEINFMFYLCFADTLTKSVFFTYNLYVILCYCLHLEWLMNISV